MNYTLGLIDDIGLSPDRQAELHALSEQAELAADRAQRAGALSYEITYAQRAPMLGADGEQLARGGELLWNEPGDPVLDADRRPTTFWGKVGEKTQPEWLNDQLNALFNLRNRLVGAEPIVERRAAARREAARQRPQAARQGQERSRRRRRRARRR